jgi:hypothetical protein
VSDLAEWLLTCIVEDEKTAPDIHHRDCESVQFDYGGVALGPCNCGIPNEVAADGDPEGPSRRAATYGNLPARVVVPRRGNRTIAPVLPTGRREPRFVLFRP